MSKYNRVIKHEDGTEPVTVDVYDVLKAFEVHNPATAHAVKKLLCPGQRGVKGKVQDLQEAQEALTRAIELEGDT